MSFGTNNLEMFFLFYVKNKIGVSELKGLGMPSGFKQIQKLITTNLTTI
jgi:hypothetical protein